LIGEDCERECHPIAMFLYGAYGPTAEVNIYYDSHGFIKDT